VRKWKRVETADGRYYRSTLAPHEAALITALARSLVGLLDERESPSPPDELELITGMKTGSAEPPSDATLRRLLPDFYQPDQDLNIDASVVESLNSALRSMHEPAIVDAKRHAAQQMMDTVPAAGGRVELTEDDANAWIAAVNDLRLALGTMLEIGPDGPARRPADDPLAAHLNVYQWLTVLQEYLVLALAGGLSR
jgi:hypothetical protein